MTFSCRDSGHGTAIDEVAKRVHGPIADRCEYDTAAFEQYLKVAWLSTTIRLLRPSMMWRAALANQHQHKRPTPVTRPVPQQLAELPLVRISRCWSLGAVSPVISLKLIDGITAWSGFGWG